MKYILALDQGTTSSRAIVFDSESRAIGVGQKELTQNYPRAGWVEHDPEEIWQSQIETIRTAIEIAGVSAAEIAGLGITNQRETTIIWDRSSGRPIHNAIVWQDRRTSAFCGEIKRQFGTEIRRKTGLEVDAYFSASKISWLLDKVAHARTRAENGELAFGTVDSWLVWKLTGGRSHVTDYSNASRTLLFDITRLEWDDELLEIFNIPRPLLPDAVASSGTIGEVSCDADIAGIPIAGIAGDQQAALFGQTCTEAGDTKNTYGTGCFMLQNTGAKPADATGGLLRTVGWKIGTDVIYAIEGSVFIGGAVVQWLRDALGIIDALSDVETLAASVADNGGVVFVPAFAGLGTPYWNQEARGLIIGLTRGTGAGHIARAAVEAIAFQTADLLAAVNASTGATLSELRVDGGASKNDMLLQFQSDVLQIPIVRPEMTETTALGAAYLAGLAVEFWKSPTDLKEHWRVEKRFEPKMSSAAAESLKSRWSEAVRRSLDWEK